MPIFLANGATAATTAASAVTALSALQGALADCERKYLWLSAYALSDLVAIGYNASDAQALMTAFHDADAIYQLNTTGALPAGYALPYTFGTSMRAVIGG